MTRDDHLHDFFRRVTRFPAAVLLSAAAVASILIAGIGKLSKDASVDAFIPPDHPSIVVNEKVRETFGVGDPIIVAVEFRNSVFAPAKLAYLRTLHEALENLPDVRPGGVTSLASESSILPDGDYLDVRPYIPEGTLSPSDAESAAKRWKQMPPHQGTIVAENGLAAAIILELSDDASADAAYRDVQSVLAKHDHPDARVYVAGLGAVVGHLSSYIDRDTARLVPLMYAVIFCVLFLAFRSVAGVLAPLIIIAGSVGGTIGLMGWLGIPYFAITNALPVILVAISVADALHVLSSYYSLTEHNASLPVRARVCSAMVDVCRPVTLTTMTTIAAFVGIGATAIMPPIEYFAWFAAFGVALAWLFSILALPNLLILIDPGSSPAFRRWQRRTTANRRPLVARICLALASRPVLSLTSIAGVVVLATTYASTLRVDRALIEAFAIDESIRVADERLNALFVGTSLLDVVVTANERDGVLNVDTMHATVRLQEFMEQLPHLQKTVAISDYLSLLHRALYPTTPPGSRTLPSDSDALAQYLLLYEASASPTDFDQEITRDRRSLLIRGFMNSRYYSEEKAAVESLQAYLDEHFADADASADIAGRVNVRYNWMVRLGESHFRSLALSLALIAVLAMVLFRSLSVGMICLAPIGITILVVYAVMGYFHIYLEPATTMFAAISFGVGIDFAIHLAERIVRSLRARDGRLDDAVDTGIRRTVRACAFNAVALGLGFAVLTLSELLTLTRFGAIVATAAFGSFVASLLLVPFAFSLLHRMRAPGEPLADPKPPRLAVWIVVVGSLLAQSDATSSTQPRGGEEVARQISGRQEARFSKRELAMRMTDRRGRTRERHAVVLKRREHDGRKTLIVYRSPRAIQDTAFLSHDPSGREADARWLFVPAGGKIRRIPTSDRGDNFLGTDFSYEDVQSELKFDLEDYTFELGEPTHADDRLTLHGESKSPAVARELGYGGFAAVIDTRTWVPVTIDFRDPRGTALKRVEISEVHQVNGIWTPGRITAVNHQTGHRTEFIYGAITFPDDMDAGLFDPGRLRRGIGADVERATR